MKLRAVMLFVLLSMILTVTGQAGTGELKELTFGQVALNQGEPILKSLPVTQGWLDAKTYLVFDEYKILKVDAGSGKTRVFLDASGNKALNEYGFTFDMAGDTTANFNRCLFASGDQIFLYTAKTGKLESLSLSSKQANLELKNPTLSPDGTKIAYTLNADLYIYHIAEEKTVRCTRDANENILNGYASWVYYEEILGRRSRYRAFWWSPDSRKIVFMRFDQTNVPVFPLFNPKNTYGELENTRYPKPGYPNPTVKLGIIHADRPNAPIHWIPFKDPKDHYLGFPRWNRDSGKIFFQWINRGQDHQKILAYNLDKDSLETVYDEKQTAWVEFFESDSLYILGNDDLIVRSSRDGWHHLYYVGPSKKIQRLTGGDWTVNGIEQVDEKKKRVFFSAFMEDSTCLDLYRTGFRDKTITRLTSGNGFHQVDVSPSGRYFIDSFSNIKTPPRMSLHNAKGKQVRVIADSVTPAFKSYRLGTAKLDRFETADGYRLPALWHLPPGFDKNKKYPVVITVYGGPGAALVHDKWQGGYRRGFARFFMIQQGIINLYVDHRGTGHFGKKGMDLMHRNLGKWEMHDLIEAVKHIRTLPYVDKDRIGIVGHSYGGYVAAMALTYGAEYFKYGISGSPVTDWRLYDSVYTERYMDTPKENPEGYKNSSTLTYMDRFNGHLRMTHGAMDDNVHPQNAMQFIDKLLDTGHTAELMIYPGARHGIGGKKRTEYMKSNLNFWLKHFFNRTIK